MTSKFKSIVEIKRIDPKDVKASGSKTVKILDKDNAYVQDESFDASPILTPEKETTYDLRLRQRFITRGNWSIQSIEDFEANLPQSPDDVIPFKDDQPALGLYDEETLKRIQKAFPYKVKKTNHDNED
jgi:hypothetical protein